MPFVFLVVGIGLLVIAVRGTQATAFRLLQSEFSGPNSFLHWALAIFILGGIGYIPVIRPVTRWLLALVIIAIIVANKGGLFQAFNDQVANPVAPPAPAPTGGDTTAAPTSGDTSTATPPGQPPLIDLDFLKGAFNKITFPGNIPAMVDQFSAPGGWFHKQFPGALDNQGLGSTLYPGD